MYRQNRTLKQLTIIALILTLSTILAAAETTVSVDAPEFESSSTFDAEIRIENVDELDSGEFHLIFDPNVVNVTDVMDGSIDDKTVEITGVVDKRYDKFHGIGIIRVAFNVDGTGGASGSGSLSTISFEVTGGDGNCSFLNISNPNPIIHIEGFDEGKLWDIYADGYDEGIPASWENGIVCIGDPSFFDNPADSDNSTDLDNSTDSDNSTDLDNSTDSDNSTHDIQQAEVTIYVENRDDDTFFVELHIDEVYTKKRVKLSGDYNEKYYDGYRLDEGVHAFTIKWHDPDTDKDYEKTEEYNVSGTTAVTLRTDEHTEDEDKISACVDVENLDDDDLDVYLYIDEVYEKYKKISSNGSKVYYGEYEFEKDEETLHSFKIEWHDPGTGENYEKITRSYITGEKAVTLYVDKHTEEDIILFSDETPTPVPTPSTPVTTSTRSASNPQPPPSNTPSSSTFHTDPTLSENSAENNGLGHSITPFYTLIGVVAALFALLQIRRI